MWKQAQHVLAEFKHNKIVRFLTVKSFFAFGRMFSPSAAFVHYQLTRYNGPIRSISFILYSKNVWLWISYEVDVVNRNWEATVQSLNLIIFTRDLQLGTEDILLEEMGECEKLQGFKQIVWAKVLLLK